MIKKLIIIFLTVLFLNNYELKAQDPSFSQFYANSLYLNPALAGSTKCPRFSLNFRDQYPNLQHTYITSSISFDKQIKQGGVGLMLYNDNQNSGSLNTINISGIYSYSLNVTKKFSIRTGFQASYIQQSINTNNMVFSDMIDEMYGTVKQTNENLNTLNNQISIFDLSVGAIGFSKNYYVGFAVHHLTKPPQSLRDANDSYLPRKYTLHAGLNIPIKGLNVKSGEMSVSPAIVFQQQDNMQQITYGSYLRRLSLMAGVFVRHNLKLDYDSFIMMLGFDLTKFKIAYSYDLTMSKLLSKTLGAHEISISAELNCNQKKKKFKTINCPTFS